MKRQANWFGLALSLIFGVLAIGCVPELSPALPSSYETQNSHPTAFVLDISGKVELTRGEWDPSGNRASISPGAEFHQGDLLYVSENTKVTILCGDLTIQTLTKANSYGLGAVCPGTETVIWMNDGNLLSSPRGYDIHVPYILSPRATKLLNSRPTLRWTVSAGAKSYKVMVMADTEIFSATTTATSIEYTGQSLIPNKEYFLIVIPDKNNFLIDQDPNRKFSLLAPDLAEKVHSVEEKVKSLKLTKENELLVITHIYMNYALYAEAIERLDNYFQGKTENGRLSAQLGEMYLRIGLPELAEKWCELAVLKAKAASDREMLAQSLVCVGRAYAGTGQIDLAMDSLHKARDIYEKLGAQTSVDLIDALLQQ